MAPRRSAQTPPEDPAPPVERSGPRDTSSTVFEVLRDVAPLIVSDDTSLGETYAHLCRAVDALILQAEVAGPPPAALQSKLDALRDAARGFDVRALVSESGAVPLEECAIVHPVLEILIQQNFQHLEQRFGRDVAERAFAKVLTALRRPARRRGRPQEMPLDTVQKAKVLRDQGRSYAQISHQLPPYTRDQIRAALTHHYPTHTRGNSSHLPHREKSTD